MAIIKISEIQSRIGTVIPSIGGTIISVFPSKSGKGQHGNWKLQNIKIQDSTGDCSVTLSGMDQDLNDSHKGKNIEFESVGTKFGLRGVTVEKRDYMNKKGENVTTIGVKVTATAKVKLEGAGMIQEDAKDDVPMAFSEQGQPLMPYPEKAVAGFNKNENEVVVDNFKNGIKSKSPQERIAQFGKLYAICMAEASDAFPKGMDIPLELRKDVASCLFIQSVREGLADKMEVKAEF